MTNREKYKEEICDIAINRGTLAVNERTLEPCTCSFVMCINCIAKEGHCSTAIKEWANSKYVEPCPFGKDELVEVSEFGKRWVLRYFSHEENGRFYCWEDGLTSKETVNVHDWKYCRKYGTLGGLVDE